MNSVRDNTRRTRLCVFKSVLAGDSMQTKLYYFYLARLRFGAVRSPRWRVLNEWKITYTRIGLWDHCTLRQFSQLRQVDLCTVREASSKISACLQNCTSFLDSTDCLGSSQNCRWIFFFFSPNNPEPCSIQAFSSNSFSRRPRLNQTKLIWKVKAANNFTNF